MLILLNTIFKLVEIAYEQIYSFYEKTQSNQESDCGARFMRLNYKKIIIVNIVSKLCQLIYSRYIRMYIVYVSKFDKII